jgi:hypothetical protein
MMKAVITLTGRDHPRLIQLRKAGHWSALDAEIRALKDEFGAIPLDQYVPVSEHVWTNSLTTEGVIQAVGFLTGVSNSGFALYMAPFSSNSTPNRDWDGDFGAASGGAVTEFTAYASATRPAITFAAATANEAGTVVTSVGGTLANAYVVDEGTPNTDIYGAVLTNNSTKQYAAGAALCIAAARASEPRPVWSAGLAYAMQYALSAPSILPAA